jgi:hypothetical protein
MPRKRHTAEQIIGLLRQAEAELAQGRMVGEVCRVFGYRRQHSTAGVRNMAA